ncbi:MAG: peptidoglycan DD-metalloendopeptidase family protein [Xanthobacteraceae bacterium]
MILRRSRPTDPRFALGPALALLLPFGANVAALAQTGTAAQGQNPGAQFPSGSTMPAAGATQPPDALKQHDQELEAVRAQQRKSADSQAKLRLQIEALAEDRRALNARLIESASHVRDVEAKIDAAQARLQALDERQQVFQKSLDERRAAIVEILAALQRVGGQPPPALLVRPEDALKALRTAITLGAVVPGLRAQADAIAGDLADLLRVLSEIVAERTALSRNLDRLARERLRLNMLIDARQKKQRTTEVALASEQRRAATLAHQADSLADLIVKLEANLGPAGSTARAQAPGAQNGAMGRRFAALSDPGRLAPAMAFADTRGQLHFPVNGIAIRGFGNPDGAGGTQKGLSIAAHPGAEITAPCDGWVVYAGPFRSYGQLLILNAGSGYHVLLAGMERISVDLGQFVLTGEPVAVMGGKAQASAAIASRSNQPVLYVEFRKDGAPIDPSPWWAANEGEKVRG